MLMFYSGVGEHQPPVGSSPGRGPTRTPGREDRARTRPRHRRPAPPHEGRRPPSVARAPSDRTSLSRFRDRRHPARHGRAPGAAGVSSRLAVDALGRTVAIVTVRLPDLEPGHCFLVVDPRVIGLMPTLGRLPSPRERSDVRAPYDPTSAKRRRAQLVEVPDEQLAEQAAIELARI